MLKTLSAFFLLLCAISSIHATSEEKTAASAAFFNEQVLPLFESRCYQCHSHESGKAKGGLVLDSRNGWEKGGSHGPVISPGQPEESLLMRAVLYTDEDFQMPPKKQLPPEEVAILKNGSPTARSIPG